MILGQLILGLAAHSKSLIESGDISHDLIMIHTVKEILYDISMSFYTSPLPCFCGHANMSIHGLQVV